MTPTACRRLAAGLLLAAGCSAPPRHAADAVPVTGTVTLDGQPLPDGEVGFSPAGGGDGFAAGPVKDGAFELRARPGAYRVEVRRPREADGGKAKFKTGMARRAESLPARYNSKTELKAAVTPAGPNRFEFALKSDPKPPGK